MCLGDLVVFSQRSSTRPAQVLPAILLLPANHLFVICPAHQPFHATYGTLGSVPAAVHSQSFTFFKVDHRSLDCSIFRDSRCTATSIAHDVGKYSRNCMYPSTQWVPHPRRPFDESDSLCMADVTSCAVRSQCVGCARF
jgi:hypothetical protein